VAADARVLRSDHLPTPYTAEEIRANSPVGRKLRALVTRAGVEPYVRVTQITWADAVGWRGDGWTETPDGRRLTEPEREEATWLELQGHASMPAATTRIDEETIDLPGGRYECLRYTRDEGESVDTFWFAKSEPGAPVRFEKRVGGELVFSSTAIGDRRA
jgi:hypothetical protein